MNECAICETPSTSTLLCEKCGRAYDRWRESHADDGTMDALIRWTAKRARHFAKRTAAQKRAAEERKQRDKRKLRRELRSALVRADFASEQLKDLVKRTLG